MLAGGRALTATDVAGVVLSRRGEDRRLERFFIPQANRPEPGILEWGIVRLDIRPRRRLVGVMQSARRHVGGELTNRNAEVLNSLPWNCVICVTSWRLPPS